MQFEILQNNAKILLNMTTNIKSYELVTQICIVLQTFQLIFTVVQLM